MAEKMLGERIKKFVKDHSVSTRPCVPNGGRRNVTVNHLLLSRSNRRLPRAYVSQASVLVRPAGQDTNGTGEPARDEVNLNTEAQLVRSNSPCLVL